MSNPFSNEAFGDYITVGSGLALPLVLLKSMGDGTTLSGGPRAFSAYRGIKNIL